MTEPKEGASCALSRQNPVEPRAHVRVGARVLTMELAETFAGILLSDITHSMESAALEAGLRPSTIHDAVYRYRHDKCTSLRDEEICEVVFKARAQHIKDISGGGYMAAAKGNKAATAWVQWQLEVQAPLEHPRKQVEVTAAAMATAGDGQATAAAGVKYVVTVPDEEPEDD